MRTPHILDLAQHVRLVLLPRSVVAVLLIKPASIVLWALIVTTNVVQFGHHATSTSIHILVALEQRRVHLSLRASIAATSTFTSKSRCVILVVTR